MLKKNCIIFVLSLLIANSFIMSQDSQDSVQCEVTKCSCNNRPKPKPKPANSRSDAVDANENLGMTGQEESADLDEAVTCSKCGCGAKPNRPKPANKPNNRDVNSGEVIHLESRDEFSSLVANASGPVVVKFFGTWCPPCRALAPVFKQVASEFKNKAVFIEIDVDKFDDLCEQWNVRSYPTLIFFNDGKKVTENVGGMRADQLRKLVSSTFKI